MRRSRPRIPHRGGPSISIVGGGIVALMTAICLATFSRKWKQPLHVRVFEAGAFGGGPSDRTASNRCQLWFHFQGVLYALRQPAVSLELQRSTAILKKLVPWAFRHPLAFAIQRPQTRPDAADCFQMLGIWHELVPEGLLEQWYPEVSLAEGATVYRVRDGTIDLRLLSLGLKQHARQLGVELVCQRVTGLSMADDHRVRELALANGNVVPINDGDAIVLACGAGIRPLLGQAGIVIPGLRHFVSHLLATEEFGLCALFIVLAGGNCVPHETVDGRLLNLFGNTRRTELFPDTDGIRLQTDEQAVAHLLADVEREFGLRIPPDRCIAWPAVKTEIVPEGNRSQSHHAFRVQELPNVYVAIPGKLSASAACGEDMAIKVMRDLAGEQIAQPIWEG